MNMKIIVIVLTFVLSGFLASASTPPIELANSSSPEKKAAANAKQGNVIEEWEVEINLGLIKLTLKGIKCDGMKDRICYKQAGESTAGSSASVQIPSLSKIYGGTFYDVPEVTQYGAEGTETKFLFLKDTYFEESY